MHLCKFIIKQCRFLSCRRTLSICFYSTSNKNQNTQKLYYDVLDVPHNASQSQIKSAYFKLSKLYHPDVNKSPEAQAKFHEFSQAYEILGSTYSRRMYDRGLVRPAYKPVDQTKVRTKEEEIPVNPLQRPPGKPTGFSFDKWYSKQYKSYFARTRRKEFFKEEEKIAQAWKRGEI